MGKLKMVNEMFVNFNL